MSFKITCPHCQKPITEKEFLENEQSIAHLQQFFNDQEIKYEQQLKEKLQKEWKEQQKVILEVQLKTQENQLNSQNQKKVNSLNDTISELQIINKTNDEKLKKALSDKELTLNKDYQQLLNQKQSEIQTLTVENKKFEQILQTKLVEKEILIMKEKQEEIDNLKEANKIQEHQLNLKINELTIKLEQGRNIKSGILGSNLENDFERKMNSFYLSDDFKKTTKAINGRKPDFILNILNSRYENETMGSILFELKNQEKLVINDVEDKLAKELKEWNADFGLIIWTAANAPFSRSKKYDNIFIINSDFEILILIVNSLKLLINKQYMLANQTKINIEDEKLMENFKTWIKDDFNQLIGKAMNEFTKFETDITKLENINKDLTKIKDNLKNILIEKIAKKLKTF